MKLFHLVLLSGVFPAVLGASEGAAWLKIPQGARSVAMGTAVSALPMGAEGLWYNPASLAERHSPDLSVSRQAWLGQTRDDYLSVSVPFAGGNVGVLANVLGTEDVYRDANGVEGGNFSDSAWTFGLAYGVQMDWLSIGFAGKMVNEKIESSQSVGYAGDIGVQMALQPWLRVGAAALNLGTLAATDNTGPSLGTLNLPRSYRVGLALEPGVDGLMVTQEMRLMPFSQESSYLAGLEYGFRLGALALAARAGYDAAAAQIGGMGGLAVGGGVQLQNLKVDFAYTPYEALGNPYRMTLGWDFGGLKAAVRDTSKEAAALPPSADQSLETLMTDGALAQTQGRDAEAESLFKQATDVYPASARPWWALFKLYYSQQRQADAVAALKEKLAREPNDEQAAWLERYMK